MNTDLNQMIDSIALEGRKAALELQSICSENNRSTSNNGKTSGE